MREKDSFVKFQLRRLSSGFCWSVFGIGALALTSTYFPLLNVFVKDSEKRTTMARKAISSSFRLFVTCVRTLKIADIDTENIKKLREEKGCIIIANHPTLLDYVFIASELPEVDCLVKAQLTKNFFLKGVVRAADYLLNNASEEILEDCRERLKKGHSILIFPEGTRTVPGQPMKLKRGVAHIALRCNAPIQAIGIKCTEKWLDKSSEWYQIPEARPSVRLELIEKIDPEHFIKPQEEGFSLASRRLTRKIGDELRPFTKLSTDY